MAGPDHPIARGLGLMTRLGFAPVIVPDDLRYSSDHEWARLEGGKVRVGITDYAQDALGDVVFVQVPETGAKVAAGDRCSEVESTKSVSDIYAPLTGTIVEVNDELAEHRENNVEVEDVALRSHRRQRIERLRAGDAEEADGQQHPRDGHLARRGFPPGVSRREGNGHTRTSRRI